MWQPMSSTIRSIRSRLQPFSPIRATISRVAIDAGQVVGFASGVDYLHPDKPPELWINEVGVAPSHQGQGLGKRLMACLLDHGRTLGCANAWVLTDHGNAAARSLYVAAGGVREPDENDADGQVVLYTFSHSIA